MVFSDIGAVSHSDGTLTITEDSRLGRQNTQLCIAMESGEVNGGLPNVSVFIRTSVLVVQQDAINLAHTAPKHLIFLVFCGATTIIERTITETSGNSLSERHSHLQLTNKTFTRDPVPNKNRYLIS